MADMESLTLTLQDHFNGILGKAAVMVAEIEDYQCLAKDTTFAQVHGVCLAIQLPYMGTFLHLIFQLHDQQICLRPKSSCILCVLAYYAISSVDRLQSIQLSLLASIIQEERPDAQLHLDPCKLHARPCGRNGSHSAPERGCEEWYA